MRCTARLVRCTLTGGLFAGLAVPALAQGLPTRTVVLAGQAAPGLPGEVFGSLTQNATINGSGRVAFRGFMSSSNSTRVWAEQPGLGLVALAGPNTVVPGPLPSQSLDLSFSESPVIADTDEVFFRAFVRYPGVNLRETMLAARAGQPIVVRAQEDQTAPGTAGGVFNFVNAVVSLAVNPRGDLAFRFGIRGQTPAGSGSGAWVSRSAGDIDVLSSNFVSPPGLLPGVPNPTMPQSSAPALNNRGESVIAARGSSAGSVWSGVWRGPRSSDMQLLVQTGDSVQAGAETWTFRETSYEQLRINDANQVLFPADLTDQAGALRGGLVRVDPDGTRRAVAFQGMAITGGPPGSTYSWSTFQGLAINGLGRLGAITRVRLPGESITRQSFVLETADGLLTAVVISGAAAPIPGENLTFGDVASVQMNALGWTALPVALRSGQSSTGSLWAVSPEGALSLVLRTGQLFDVNDDPLVTDLRTLSSFSMVAGVTGGQDGFARALNDRNELVYRATFTDGSSGVFVTTIPTPGAFALLVLAGLAVPQRRRRNAGPSAPTCTPALRRYHACQSGT